MSTSQSCFTIPPLPVWSKNLSQLEPVWDVGQAAAFLRIHPNTVYKMAKNGELPAARIGNRWKFRPGDLDNWLRSKVSCESNPALPEVQ